MRTVIVHCAVSCKTMEITKKEAERAVEEFKVKIPRVGQKFVAEDYDYIRPSTHVEEGIGNLKSVTKTDNHKFFGINLTNGLYRSFSGDELE